MRRHLRCLLFLFPFSFFLLPLAHAAEPFELKDGDRVLFIGDTFFEREGDYGQIETRLTAAFPDRNVTFRNLAWAGDSPMGRARASFDWNKDDNFWLAHVKEQLALVKPTVAFLSYGMTAALELSETKPEEQPAKLEKFKGELGKLMDAIDEVSGQKVRFVLVGPLQPSVDGRGRFQLNEPLPKAIDTIDQVHGQIADSKHVAVIHLNRMLAKTAYIQAGIVPSDDRQASIARSVVGSIVPGGQRDISEGTPAYEVLRSAILKKNELFFHRWRPENWTYLFGFRKGEQGQNGVEIPKFDPLIAQWDARIAKLRDLKHQDPATVKEVHDLLAAEEAVRSAPPQPKTVQPIPTFDVADGFEVTLWAEEPELFKPIQMNWDAQGRLWVASSRTYPMIAPGQTAADSVVVLEDTNGDHKADKSTVFAKGLLIPTGVLPDDKGGCYVAASSQLLHFADTDGDGKADQKTIVLSSFGTEDTHHNLHTLRWGYDGHMYFNQSIYTHTHIETPWGVRRLNSAGIWRFNPDNWKLEIFTKGGCNPWGHHWDQYGNSFFTDGAGGKGVYHAMEGATYFTYSDMRREADSISPGNYPKFASLEVVHSPNFPADWQGSVITCDFRAHRVVHFGMNETGSTWQTKELPDLLRSTNVTFRPIDLRFGPDGALYVADWSNPIIQHGEVDFRDPRRDHEHGRIWRVTAKAGTVAKTQNLTTLKTSALLDRTLSASGW
ncbi:MAG TPA: PVC-type heme-binding CxxCH protein, partial [Candidatus Limnocylindria bacterium]|nr:PVC-type heme-binding CxxCH protein [Candidatus Limnocylindria bacterium]